MIVTVGSMASVIVLNSKSSCSTCGFGSESKTGAITVATGAAVFGIDLALRLAFVVALTLWWRRPVAASQASHLCARI